MKKIIYTFVCVLFACAVYAQQQLSNGSFETWGNSFLYESMTDWNCLNSENSTENVGFHKMEDAVSGNYSVLMQPVLVGQDTSFSFFYHGYMTGDGPGGGIEYSEDFDGIGGYYRGVMAEHDSAVIIVVKYLEMVPTWFSAKIGGIAENWTTFHFDLPPTPCDSVFVGFISSDAFLETIYSFDSWISFDSIHFTNSMGTDPDPTLIPNYDFEDWYNVEYTAVDSWNSLNNYFNSFGVEPLQLVSDAQDGLVSAEMTTHLFMGEHIVPGYLSLGEIFIDDVDPVRGIPYTDKPSKLKGYYKYFPAEDELGIVQVLFSQFDVQIGGGAMQFAPASEFTYFEVPLNYAGDPDSLTLIFASGNIPGSRLLIDNISFDFSVDVPLSESQNISIYPNPAEDYFIVGMCENQVFPAIVEITDIQGRLLKTVNLNNEFDCKVDISDLSQGVYFVKYAESEYLQKLIVK